MNTLILTRAQAKQLERARDLINRTLSRPRGTKSDQLVEMLSKPRGASIDEVVDTFGIKKNSAYARVSVETRKRGLKVENVNGRYHVHV